MLDTERPGNDFGIDLIGNETAGRGAGVGLCRGRGVYLQQATAGQETGAACAPSRGTGKRAGDRRILLGLEFRRKAVDGEVVGNDVIGDLRTAAYGPASTSGRIPRKSHVWPDIVRICFRLAED